MLEAKDTEEALKILEEEQMDMVILDINVEPINGFEAISLIRQMPQHKDIPIISWAVKALLM